MPPSSSDQTWVYAASDGLLATGITDASMNLWSSADGRSWTSVDNANIAIRRDAAGARPSCRTACGSSRSGTDSAGTPGTWASTDGAGWTPVPATGPVPVPSELRAFGVLGPNGALLVSTTDNAVTGNFETTVSLGAALEPSVSTPSPSPSASPIRSGSPVEPSPSAEPSLGAACTLSGPTGVTLPDELGLKDGSIRAPLGDGKFLVDQFHTWVPDPKFPYRERARQVFSIWNRDTGAVEQVIDQHEPVGDTGYGQIFDVAVSPDWVIWTQEIDHAKTRVLNRRTGEVRSLHLGPGETPWGDLSVIGDTAVWDSVINPGRAKPRYGIYTADLTTGEVRQLSVDTKFASPISATQIATSQTIDSSGHAPLSQPAIVDIRTGKVEPDPWTEPAVVRGFAAGGAGTIEKRQLQESTGEHPDSIADVVLRDRDGVVRTFGPYSNMGSVAAGDRAFTWQDQQHVWALPSGQTEPILLADAGEEGNAYATVHGPWLLVHTVSMAADGNSYTSHHQLYRSDCSGPSTEPSPAPSPSVSPSVTPMPSESASDYVP